MPLLPRPLRRWLRRTAWWLAGTATALVLAWLQPTALQRLDLLAYDLLLPERPASVSAPLVVAIDDASLASLGRWPWSRAVFAEMVDRLHEAGVSGIGIDLLLTEPDRADPAGDAALAAAIARHGRVVLAAAPSRDAEGHIAALQPQPGSFGARLGQVDVEIDIDGRARRFYRRAGVDQADLPAFAAALLQDNGAGDPVKRRAGFWVREREILPPRTVGLAELSFAQLLEAPQLPGSLRGRTVFIGVTAAGLGGELATPLAAPHATLAAVDFHAQAFDALQSQSVIRRASPPMVLVLALLAVSSLLVWPARLGRRALLAGLLLGLPLAASALLLTATLVWLPPAMPTAALAVALACWLARQLRRANRQMLRSRQHAQATLQAIDDAVLTIDACGRTVRFANKTAEAQAGGRGLLGRTLQSAFPLSAASMRRLVEAVDSCLTLQHRVHLGGWLSLQTPGGQRALRATASPLHSPEGRLDGAVLVFADVTDSIAAARALDRAASHDALTGLPNRALLHERLATTLARVQRRGGMAAIFFIDLDRFKHINDSLGHRMGDEVLKVMAGRLRGLCRGGGDTVARWGGNQFVMVLAQIEGHEAATLAAAKLVEAVSQDIELDTGFSHVRVPSAGSVGVVLAPQDGTGMEDLLSKADMAMYRAKAQPRASFQFWSSAIKTRLHDRLALEMDLRHGMREHQFVLHYQPQFDFRERRLVGMEALLRWQRTPTLLVSPGEFIQVAEESDLVVDLGAWAVRQVTRQLAAWLQDGHQAVPVAVNVSARQCLNRDLVQVVRAALHETGIPPALLRLEITETTAIGDADQVAGLLRELRALGVGLAVDDFGTGHSSLAYLKRFPVDELKIDRSFVRDLGTDNHDAAIVRAIIVLAHGLGLKVVAEGVETEAQRSFLTEHGCDTAQGYLFGRPMPLQAVTRLLS